MLVLNISLMKKILAFAGSNNSKSINHQLVTFAAALLEDVEVEVLDIRTWDVPIYSIDMDPDVTPSLINDLIERIAKADGFIISSPEHNGGPSAFLKNILDWLSRRSKKVFTNKPMLLMSTSPGGGGGANHLGSLVKGLPYQGAKITSTFSLPSFNDNMKDGNMTDEYVSQLKENLDLLKAALV